MPGVKKTYGRAIAMVLILLLNILALPSFAQDPDALKTRLYGNVNSQDIGKGLENASIEIYKNGSKIQTINTDNRGRFDFLVDPGAVYKIEFKFNNHVTKNLQVDTRAVTPDSEWGGEFKFDVDLFEEREGLNVSILNKPIAKLYFNPEVGTMEHDKEYTASIKSEVERLRTELEEKLKAEADAKKELEAAYAKAIADADRAMGSGDYLKAKQEYARALGYKPDESYPQGKLEEAKKKYEEEQVEKNKEQEYKEAIESAEFALYEKNVKKAIAEFERALSIKPGDKYAKDQVKELQDKMMNQAKAEQEYLTAIQKADAALAAKDLLTAKGEYQKAIDAKPTEEYPKGQLAQVNDMIKSDAEKEQNYIKAIGRADNSMDIKDYEAAKAAYMQASQIKPEENYPKEKVTEIDKILTELAELNKAYTEAIKKADAAFSKNEFPAAKTSYNEAIKLKPEEKYPQDQLAAIEKKEIELANVNDQYNELIKEADSRFNIKEYVAAKAEYDKAIKLKPTEEYPKKRLEEVTALLNEIAKQEADYKAAIQNADNAFTANDFLSAKIEYEVASKIKPEEAYPKERLEEVKAKIAAAEQAEQQYENAIKQGDAAFAAADYAGAKVEFETATGLRPKEQYPKDKLAEISTKLVEIENTNKKYQSLITSADDAMTKESYEDALSQYKEAAALKPTEQYPKDQLVKIDGLLNAAKELDANYTAAIEKGDKSFDAKEYENARTSYLKAKELKPNEEYPTKRISEIDNLLAALAEKDLEYQKHIDVADEALVNNNLVAAKESYNKALAIKPDEQYPKDKIQEVDNKINASKELEANYANAIKTAEGAEKAKDYTAALDAFAEASKLKPEESYPKEKMTELKAIVDEINKNEAQYKEHISLADQAFDNKEYDIALSSYNNALALKPNEAHPKSRIAEIDKKKAEMNAAIELAKQQQEEYDLKITNADAAFQKQEFEDARAIYKAALLIKPEEKYPQDQLVKIDEAVKSLEAEAAAEEALAAKKEKYNAAIKDADDAFKKEEYDAAISKYEAASAILPDEVYPKDQITAINKIKADKAAAIELANKEVNDKYNALIATADQAFNSADFKTAEKDYRAALEVKPQEQYPQDQISKISSNLADQKAKEEEYNSLIATADKQFKAESFAEAIASYEAASAIKPSEQYPKDQVAESNRKIKEREGLAAQKEKEAAEREAQEKYDGFISAADKSFKDKAYTSAKENYNSALGVKPNEQYPTDQVTEIDRLIAEEAALAAKEKQAAEAAEIQEKYDAFIVIADKSFKAEDYEVAKTNYQSAAGVKPNEEYPKNQISEIDRLVKEAANLAALKEQQDAAAKKEENYNNFISSGDKSFKSKDYEVAKSSYMAALDIKPDESYPATQLTEIDRLIAEAAAKADQAKLAAEKEAKEREYKSLISEADKSFKSSEWRNAKSKYEAALKIKPNEQYPKDQLTIVDGEISNEIALLKNDQQYNDYIATADKAFDAKDYEKARSEYRAALNIKPEESYPKDRLALVDEAIANLESERSAEEEERQKRNAKYNEFIGLADNYFASESYQKATENYKAALGIKSEEKYPQDQINKISQLLSAASAKEDERKERAELLASYNAEIAKGDRAFSSKDYTTALSSYNSAISLMPNETYPKNQIKKIRDAQSQVEVAVEPVTPRATINGKSEDDIAAMMAEMKRKREQAKIDALNKQTKDLNNQEAERIANATNERQESQAEIEEIHVEIMSENTAKQEMYLANVEKVEVFTEQIEEEQKERVKKEGEKRDDANEELEKLAEERQEAFKEGDELRVINAEKVATTKIELEQDESNRKAVAQEKRTSEENEINQLAEGVRERNEAGEETRLESVDRLQTYEKDLKEEFVNNNKEAEDKRNSSYDKEKELREDIVKDKQQGDEMHYKNAEQLAKTAEEVEKSKQENKAVGDEKRMNNYDDIKEYVKEVDQITDEEYNKYQENNQRILENQEEIIAYQKQISKEADDRRNSYNPEYYTGEKEPRKSDKASQFKQGVTEETYEEGDAIIIKRTVVTGETVDEYEKIHYPYGGVFYKKNGQDITAEIWDAETN